VSVSNARLDKYFIFYFVAADFSSSEFPFVLCIGYTIFSPNYTIKYHIVGQNERVSGRVSRIYAL